MGKDIVRVGAKKLKAFMHDVFVALGVPEEDAEMCSDGLITSDLRGITSHGVQILKV